MLFAKQGCCSGGTEVEKVIYVYNQYITLI